MWRLAVFLCLYSCKSIPGWFLGRESNPTSRFKMSPWIQRTCDRAYHCFSQQTSMNAAILFNRTRRFNQSDSHVESRHRFLRGHLHVCLWSLLSWNWIFSALHVQEAHPSRTVHKDTHTCCTVVTSGLSEKVRWAEEEQKKLRWFVIQTWQVSSYSVSTYVTLHVFFFLSGEGEDWVRAWSSTRSNDRLNEAAPGASEGFFHVLIYAIFKILILVSPNWFLPCHPTALLPQNRLRHQRTTSLMKWWENISLLFSCY